MLPRTAAELAAFIDQSLLRPPVTEADLKKLCQEARACGFASVCIPPFLVRQAREWLEGSRVAVGIVCAFPFGYGTVEAKCFEAKESAGQGAAEIDMVANYGLIKEGRFDLLAEEARRVAGAARPALVKVIIECSELSDEEKVEAARSLIGTGVSFVKTSSGFASGGATAHDVRLLKEAVGERLRVKAAGGIRTLNLALALIEAGAERLGTSAGVTIVEEFRRRQED